MTWLLLATPISDSVDLGGGGGGRRCWSGPVVVLVIKGRGVVVTDLASGYRHI